MAISRANLENVDEVAKLFDLYRQFYGYEPDFSSAKQYIHDRIINHESIIFVSKNEKNIIQGFVQLYPSFCSVEAAKIMILYDLYVDVDFRKYGVGEGLMNRAAQHAKDQGAIRLDLLTAKDNLPGQGLYEKLGYQKSNENFFAYSLYV